MLVAIELFRKAYFTMTAFPRLDLIVHFLDVLLDVAALSERFAAAFNRASEWLVLRVGTHVVDKFGPVGHDTMAVASKFALEESLADFVALVASEAKYHKFIRAWEAFVVF